MVEFKTEVYPFCVMVYADEGEGIRCNIARFDYCIKNDEYFSVDEALEEAESLIERNKEKWIKKYKGFEK